MVAPTVKTIPRYNVPQERLIKDSFGEYIEYKHVEKQMTQESATLLAAVAKVRELTAERDRLLTENAELRADLFVVGGAFSHANATLDRLREVVPEDYLDFDEMHPERDFDDLESAIRACLYPKETDNGES